MTDTTRTYTDELAKCAIMGDERLDCLFGDDPGIDASYRDMAVIVAAQVVQDIRAELRRLDWHLASAEIGAWAAKQGIITGTEEETA
jgi:hypothetical protein